MTDESTPVAETTAAPEAAPAKKKAVVKKKAAAKPAKKKVAKKKVAKKVAKKKSTATGEGKGRMDDTHVTIRLRMFKLLAKGGQTGAKIAEKLELSGIPNILRDEGIMANPPRIKREMIEGTRGVVYSLTAAGKKALEKGTVNSEAPAAATGKDWK